MSYLHKPRPILVVKNNLYAAQRLYERIACILSEKECALFGADESLRVEAIARSSSTMANKVETLYSLIQNPCQVVVTCPSGYLRLLPKKEVFENACISLKVDMQMEPELLKEKLRDGGYEEISHIDQPLSFAARGGIIDVYSINYEQPVRIEFFDDVIESIRYFDVTTQKTIETVNEVHIVPASDILFSEEDKEEIKEQALKLLEQQNGEIKEAVNTALSYLENGIQDMGLYPYMALEKENASLIDYMNHPLLIYSDENEIRESIHRLMSETTQYIQEMIQENKLLPIFSVWHNADRIAKGCKSVLMDPYMDNISNITTIHLPNDSLARKLKLLPERARVLLCIDEKRMEQVLNTCIEEKIPYRLLKEEEAVDIGINILFSPLSQGFSDSTKNLWVVSEAELFQIHHHTGRYEKKFQNAEVIHGYEELEIGDYVVHSTYGVGQYMGIENREVQGVRRDFLRVIYKGNAELLVPLEQFGLVRKFVSREGVVPKLNKLGSGDWEKTKKKLEENVTDLADRLVDLYANREQHIGYAYQPDTEEQKKFDASFQYELTPDQEKAVEAVKRDMESNKPMDRLICGDVGFGKTEIAVRAAFKAVSENKQCAILCPTTILAEQHYQTFTSRFDGWPFTIAVLDRFRTAKEVRETLQNLREGKLDIIVGTHRLLSKDVVFKDLGLLVVDEEQRFGVEHKERIKEFKNAVDVLTLSATPIPRTLQMSLVGIRSLSQLNTPPLNRYSVQTYVVEKNAGLVTDAIEKELARDGQVFYLYNSIDTIYNVARTLQSNIPDARIGIVHGKMDRDAIEEVMYQFNQRELNVLVCTTIIENGIDIPNANTILIDNAQNFGLSQIYQMKGRVGRSDRVAYCYLLVPPRKQLTETATKRLQAVKEFAKLGSGYKIAMRDLTIRGAGDLLGSQQSGFIDTVGIDMYIEMLEQAIERKKGHIKEAPKEFKRINVKEDSYIPKQFAPDDFDKIDMYQKIDQLNSLKQLEAYEEEVKDQYGRLPKEVDALFQKRRLTILVNEPYVESYKEIKDRAVVTFSSVFSQNLDGVKLFKSFLDISKDIELRYTDNRIIAYIPKNKETLVTTIRVLQEAPKAKRV